MSHEGRMARGAENFSKGILLDNNDTLYFLANKPKEVEQSKTKKKTTTKK